MTSSVPPHRQVQVNLPVWNGPMDLLLDLIRANEVNIYDIPIAEITHQYLETIRLMQKLDIELASEFLVMAATLVYIKTRMMIPADLDDEEDDPLFRDPRANLVQQLLEYQKYKKLAEVLEDQEFHAERIIERKDRQQTFDLPEEEDDSWKEVTLFELIKVFSGVVKILDYEDFQVLREEEEDITIDAKMDEIEAEIMRVGKLNFYDLFNKHSSKFLIIIIFWAILELYKMGKIIIKQHQLFGDIFIFSREHPEAAPREIPLARPEDQE